MPKLKTEFHKTASSFHWLLNALTLVIVFAFSCNLAFGQQSSGVQPAPSITPDNRSRAATPGEASGDVKAKTRASETLIDGNIPEDPVVNKLLEPYGAKVRALEVVIGKLEGDLKKGGMGGGTLGNFVTDGVRDRASKKLGKPVSLAITNSGGLRKDSIAEGDLRASDIFELLPFENALVDLKLTGEQMLKLLRVVVSSRDPQSGAKIKYRFNAEKKPEFISATLVDSEGHEKEIDPQAMYEIVTIDYLLKVEGGSHSMLQLGKDIETTGITLRDAVIYYVKSETAAGKSVRAKQDGRFSLIGPDTSKSEDQPQ
jgi:2',3'-cyclic-nucleotide 2'-phosphodiesterase (5'-nucleotidase family)